MSRDDPKAAVGHMPFKGHRTQAQVHAFEEGFAEAYVAITGKPALPIYTNQPPLNRKLIDDSERLVGRWR